MNKLANSTLLIILVFISFISGTWSIPLFDWDEGAFSEASREMITSGDYITTYMNGELRFAKPILTYWLQSLSMNLIGINTFAVRLPSVISAVLWAFGLYYFARKLYGKEKAFFATVFMISALQISVIARAAISDASLNLFIAGSMFSMYLYHVERRKIHIYAMYFMIGLGVLTKGPIAIFIPAVTSILFFIIKREFKHWFVTVISPVGIAIFLITALPWYILEYLDQEDAFINGFFLKNNIGRFNNSMEGHGGTFFYYIPVILIGFLPFTSVLIFGLFATYRDLTSEIFNFRKKRTNSIGKRPFEQNSRNDILFYFLWFLIVFIFFSFSSTKLPHYVIYGYTPLFIIMALYIDRIKNERLLYLPPFLLSLILTFILEIVTLSIPFIKDDYALSIIRAAPENFDISYRIFIGLAAVFYGILMLIPKFKNPRIKIGLAAIIFITVMNMVFLPAFSATLQLPVTNAARFARENNLDVVVWRIYWPSFIFYSQKLTPVKIPADGDIVLMKSSELHYFPDRRILYEKNGVILAQIGRISQSDYMRMMTR